LIREDAGEPPFVALERPAAVDDEEPIELGRRQGMDEISGVAFS
jgi:hypothetical protein